MVRSILTWFINRTKLHHIIEKIQNEEKITRCINRVTNNGGTFLPESNVVNQQNDPLKITIGRGTVVAGLLLIFKYGGEISIGENCYVGDQSRIWSGERISIGNNVLISHNVNIIDTNAHELNSIERSERYTTLINNGPWPEKGSIITSEIVIEDYAWISFNATILKGVTIGQGAVVGAGSVVTRNVQPYTLVAGNPAVEIKNLDR